MSGQTVVDVGTGSGILAIVAKLQGASKVQMLDINPEAIAVAFENGKRNGVRILRP
jgi:ribosomal protein L11 methyltransferase